MEHTNCYCHNDVLLWNVKCCCGSVWCFVNLYVYTCTMFIHYCAMWTIVFDYSLLCQAWIMAYYYYFFADNSSHAKRKKFRKQSIGLSLVEDVDERREKMRQKRRLRRAYSKVRHTTYRLMNSRKNGVMYNITLNDWQVTTEVW